MYSVYYASMLLFYGYVIESQAERSAVIIVVLPNVPGTLSTRTHQDDLRIGHFTHSKY